jgi:hypothetical protein
MVRIGTINTKCYFEINRAITFILGIIQLVDHGFIVKWIVRETKESVTSIQTRGH